MGVVRKEGTGAARSLGARSVVGRTAACALRLDDARVSSEHAVLAWRDGRWFVRDLGSRNGTFVGDVRVTVGEEIAVQQGDVLRFAQERWTLVDAAPPGPAAVDLDADARVDGEYGVLLLPDADEPALSVALDETGAWSAVSDADQWVVADGDVVSVAGRRFRLSLPTSSEPTVRADGEIGVEFVVSSDEEHVEVALSRGPTSARLAPRSHHYMLLTLARIRVAQVHRSSAERGWIHRDDLARMLRVDPRTVNVQVHRARQDLGRQEVDGAAHLLEVRGRTGQIRLGTDLITIRS